MKTCRNCGSTNVTLSARGILAPFFNYRVHHISDSARALVRLCQDCEFVGVDAEYTSDALSPLYIDYRQESYNEQRCAFEPGYADVIPTLGVQEVPERLAYMDEFLALHHVKAETIFDWGGADGLFIPTAFQDKYVAIYDPSNLTPVNPNYHVGNNVEGQFDYIQICHVMEHLGSPAEALTQILNHLKPGGHLYLEVPKDATDERLKSILAKQTDHYIHEHLNLYSEKSLRALGIACGLRCVEVKTQPIHGGDTFNILGLFQK